MPIIPSFLIVDDDYDDIDFFKLAVSRIFDKVEVQTAINGEEALIIIRKDGNRLPDYIFLDLNMQRMDGRKCLMELQSDSQLNSIPVIIYSTSSAYKDIEDTKKLGASYFITKPTSLKELQAEIEKALLSVNKEKMA